jgi:tetratricopeptide (TPR) repeat protein
MTPELWQRVKGALEELSGTDPEGRLRLLAALEPDTRREVERLLPGLESTPSREHSSLLLPDPETLAEWIAGAQTFEAGQVLIDRFEIDRALGRGGMGEVFSAQDRLLGKVAIKTLLPEFVSSKAMVERFRSEILRGRAVSHPNVCRIHDLFDTENGGTAGVPFFTMELIDGPVLATWIPERAGLPEPEATALAEALCAGLQAAHEAGVIHGDFKAANIILSPQPDGTFRPKITDFGLAREVPWRLATETPEGTGVRGTKPYLAPELMAGSSASVSSDIFALGIVLYFLRTARYPYPEAEWEEAKEQRRTPPALADLIRDCGDAWGRAIFACLQPIPSHRPPSAAAVAQLLRRPDPADGLDRRQVMGAVMVGAITGTGARWAWPVPYAPPRGKLRTLVEDFETAGASPAVGRSVQTLFRTALAPSRRISLVTPQQVAEAVQLIGNGAQRLQGPTSRAVAERTQSRLLVQGKVTAEGTRYRLACQAVDLAAGRVVLTWRETSVLAFDLPAGAGQLAMALRQELGEQGYLAQMGEPLEQADTLNPAALEAFALGVNLFYAGERQGAIAKLREATRLDPDFALAYIHEAHLQIAFRRPDLALAPALKAHGLRDHLNSRHRHHIAFTHLFLRGDFHGAHEELSMLAQFFPDDPNVLRAYAQNFMVLGQPEQCLRVMQRAIQIDPDNHLNVNLYSSTLLENGRSGEAQQVLDRALAAAPDSAMLNFCHAYLHLYQLRIDAALSILEPMSERYGITAQARDQAVKAKVLGGRMASARDQLQRDLPLRQAAGDENGVTRYQYWLAQVALLQGDYATATPLAASLARLAPEPINLEALRHASELAWLAGDRAAAREASRRMAQYEGRYGSSRSRSFGHFARAVQLSLEGDALSALAAIETADGYWPDIANAWAWGEILMDLGRPAEAAGKFLRAAGSRAVGIRFDSPALWVLCHARAAAAMQAAGQASAARQQWSSFEAFWGPPQQYQLRRRPPGRA